MQLLLRCPCCGNRTLSVRSTFEVCVVCRWEDYGQDGEDAGIVRGGPNGVLSLAEARANYQAFGACRKQDLPHARPPSARELP